MSPHLLNDIVRYRQFNDLVRRPRLLGRNASQCLHIFSASGFQCWSKELPCDSRLSATLGHLFICQGRLLHASSAIPPAAQPSCGIVPSRSEEHTSELPSLMRL